ncbi:MAG TPA: hypothetical protein VGM36_05075 [Rhizomicrobium sp.]
MSLGDCGLQVFQKAVVIAGQGARAGNENIVMARQAIKGEERLRRSPEPSLGPVADNRIAQLLGGGEADPWGGGFRRAAEFHRHGRADLADAFLGAQEIGAFLKPIQWDK